MGGTNYECNGCGRKKWFPWAGYTLNGREAYCEDCMKSDRKTMERTLNTKEEITLESFAGNAKQSAAIERGGMPPPRQPASAQRPPTPEELPAGDRIMFGCKGYGDKFKEVKVQKSTAKETLTNENRTRFPRCSPRERVVTVNLPRLHPNKAAGNRRPSQIWT